MFIATISTLSELKKEKATPALVVVVAAANKQKAWHGSASTVGPSSSSLTVTLVVTKRPGRPRKMRIGNNGALFFLTSGDTGGDEEAEG